MLRKEVMKMKNFMMKNKKINKMIKYLESQESSNQ